MVFKILALVELVFVFLSPVLTDEFGCDIFNDCEDFHNCMQKFKCFYLDFTNKQPVHTRWSFYQKQSFTEYI